MAPVRVLILGHQGQLARSLATQAAGLGWSVDQIGRPDFDLAAPETAATALEQRLASARPDIVINAAAYTAVDAAETDRDQAFKVNAIAPGRLAKVCAAADIPLIHVSTDYVFSGEQDRPWRETDGPNPVSVYGESKLAGERAVAAAWHKHIILRTAWLFDGSGQNFLTTMLRLGASRDALSIVADQRGCPTPVGALAAAIVELAGRGEALEGCWGVYHYCGDTIMSWAGFAEQIFAAAEMPAIMIEAISTEAFGAPAPRPRWSALDCSKIEQVFGIKAADFQTGLKQAVADAKA